MIEVRLHCYLPLPHTILATLGVSIGTRWSRRVCWWPEAEEPNYNHVRARENVVDYSEDAWNPPWAPI